MKRFFLTLIAILALPASLPAEPNPLVDKIELGTYWTGARIQPEDLRGKVVVIEIWGFS